MQKLYFYLLLLTLIPVRSVGQSADPALVAAVRSGNVEAVSSLVAAGVNVNVISPDGYTPLLLAAEKGNLPIARILCQHGADVNFLRRPRGAAIDIAVDDGNFDLMHTLIASGADLDIVRSDGLTPLHFAAVRSRWGEAELLMISGANKESLDAQGNTPMHLAVLAGKIESLRSLLILGANPEAKNRMGQTVTQSARARGFNEAADMIVRYQDATAQRIAHVESLKESGLNFRPGFNNWGKSDTIATQVYKSPLDSAVETIGDEWTTRINGIVSTRRLLTTVSPSGSVRFLGEFGNQDVQLRLPRLPEHRSVSVQFDLLICGYWVGDHYLNGPSLWSLGLANGTVLLNTSFMNSCELVATVQSYPAEYPGGQHEHYFGSKEHETLGYHGRAPQSDAIYHLAYTFDSSDANVELVFRGNCPVGVDQASWGLKNVEVTVGSPAPPKPVIAAAPKTTITAPSTPTTLTPKPIATTTTHKTTSPTKISQETRPQSRPQYAQISCKEEDYIRRRRPAPREKEAAYAVRDGRGARSKQQGTSNEERATRNEQRGAGWSKQGASIKERREKYRADNVAQRVDRLAKRNGLLC